MGEPHSAPIHAVDLTMTAFCTRISAKLHAVVLGVGRHELVDHCSRADSAKRCCHSCKPFFRCHRLLFSELYLAYRPRSAFCNRLRNPAVLFARNVPGHSRANLPNVRESDDCDRGFVCTGARISRTSSIGYGVIGHLQRTLLHAPSYVYEETGGSIWQQRDVQSICAARSRLAVKSAPNSKPHFVFAYRASEGANLCFVRRCRPISTGQFHLGTTPANRQLC